MDSTSASLLTPGAFAFIRKRPEPMPNVPRNAASSKNPGKATKNGPKTAVGRGGSWEDESMGAAVGRRDARGSPH